MSFEIAALRLHLVVGMAAADDEIHPAEVDGLAEFVETVPVSDAQRTYLKQMLIALITQPPHLETLLRKLVEQVTSEGVALQLVDDLVTIAHLDNRIDPREEGMLRLVCGALKLDAVSLHEPHEHAASDASASELAALVRELLQLDDPTQSAAA